MADAVGLKEVVGEGLREAMGPIEDLVERGWEAVVGQLVSQSATTLQVRGKGKGLGSKHCDVMY
jgi:hypothetical protein